MEIDKAESLLNYRECFKKLQTIVYRDLYINGACFRLLAVNLLDYGPGWSIKKHKHSFFEACYITENITYTTINEREYLLNPGQFYILSPGTFHSHRQDAEKGHVGFGLRWEIKRDHLGSGRYENIFPGVEYVWDRLLNVHGHPVADEKGEVLGAMLKLLNMPDGKINPIALQMEAFQLISLISRFYNEGLKESINEKSQSFIENKTVEAAVSFIDENFTEGIDVEDVAQFVHLSYIQLYRLFKSYLGDTISGYLNRKRMGKAQQLLVSSNKPIGNIALETGFNSENHFCRAFKKFCGVTPMEYRSAKGPLSE